MFKKIQGTKDILPEEVVFWQALEESSRKIFATYNYREIRTPILEDERLFNRSLGEGAEIVQKQMFCVKTKEDSFVLRPEGTACVMRSYLENNLDKTAGFAKLYYIGPMFRYERPQKGRLRQFHHIACEAIGSNDPMLDVEVILVARDLLTAAVVENYKIRINSIGCARDKKELGAILRRDLKEKLPRLCPECKKRYSLNALRILDCKNEECRKEIGRLDIKDAYLCVECRDHFKKVLRGLDELGVNYELSDKLVRGLDYYTGTVFEITHASLGAQDALGAGGRYNNLLKELGGPELGAVGFALGVERVLLARGAKSAPKSPELVYLITLTDMAKAQGLKVLESLRGNGIYSDTDYEAKSLKGALRKANDLNARLCLIIGEDELKNNTVTLKDMASGQQNQISADDAASQIGKILNTGERC